MRHKRFLAVVTGVLLVFGIVGFGMSSSAHAANRRLTMSAPCDMHGIAGHRGGHYPGITENTVRNFRYAVNHGIRVLELDFQPTSDGQIVLVHNRTWNDMTIGRPGSVRGHSGAYARHLRTTDGHRVTFAPQFFRFLKNHPSVIARGEIKTYGDNWNAATIAKLAGYIRDYGVADQMVVTSGKMRNLRIFHDNLPGVRLEQVVFARGVSARPNLATMPRYITDMNIDYTAAFAPIRDKRYGTAAYITIAHRYGKHIMVRALNGGDDRQNWSRMSRLANGMDVWLSPRPTAGPLRWCRVQLARQRS
jgi:glycerophosphoryl diester phosphodiesterase